MVLLGIFSIFDPSAFYFYPFPTLLVFFILFLFVPLSSFCYFLKLFMNNFKKDINSNVPEFKGITWMLMSILIIMVNINVFSLISYSFTLSAQISFSMSLAFSLWFSVFSNGWFNNYFSSLAHLVPKGSPFFLAPLLALIELISSLIRPITLSVRLSANMMSGHLIMSLLGEAMNLFNFEISSFPLVAISILELGVTIIQSYVFCMLISLYFQEIN